MDPALLTLFGIVVFHTPELKKEDVAVVVLDFAESAVIAPNSVYIE